MDLSRSFQEQEDEYGCGPSNERIIQEQEDEYGCRPSNESIRTNRIQRQRRNARKLRNFSATNSFQLNRFTRLPLTITTNPFVDQIFNGSFSARDDSAHLNADYTIDIPKTDENQIVTYDTVDNDAYNNICFGNPIVVINSGDNLNVWRNTKYIAASEFVSVDASISYGISSTSHAQVDRLYNLLMSKKDYIDSILESQPVYAIGPDFQENLSIPCISCWVAERLDTSILEQLERIFNDEFIAINQVVAPLVDTELSGSSSSSSSVTGGLGSNGLHYNINYNNKNLRKRRRQKDDNDDSDDDGSDDDNDDGDGDGNGENIIANNDITISSGVTAKIENQNVSQSFDVAARFRAETINEQGNIILRFHVDVFQCSMQDMLSNRCAMLRKEGDGYYLDSIEVCVSPVKNDPGDTIAFKDRSHPSQQNRIVERSESRERNVGINGRFGTTTTVGFDGGFKDIYNTKYTSNEWKLTHNSSHKCGDRWLYKHVSDGFYDERLSFSPGIHSGEWYVFGGCGFRITITQVVRFKIKWFNKIRTKPKLIKCPVMAHTLEVTFNSLTDFNTNFAALKNVHVMRSDFSSEDVSNKEELGMFEVNHSLNKLENNF